MTATEAEALLRAAPWRRAVPMPSAVPSPSPHNTPDALYVSAHNDSLYSSLAARCSPPPASTPALQTPLSACRRRRASGSPCPRRPRVCPPATQRPVVPGGGSTARPGAAWHRRPLRPVPVPIPIPIPVPPGTAGTPASAASSGPAPAAHPCASAGRCGAARHGDDPHGPPLQAPSPPYPIDDDPGDVLVRRVESVRQLSVAVHQGGPQLPLRAGGDAACIQLRGVQLQALCSGIRASQSAFGLGGTLKIGEGSRGAGGSAIQPSDSWWRRSPTPCRR